MLARRGALAACLALGACERDPGRAAPEHARVIVRAAPEPYVAMRVVDGGRITGRVLLTGARPPDSLVTVAGGDSLVCGRTAAVAPIRGSGQGVADALVWLVDIRRGRALPVERRHEVLVRGCVFEPRVQGVVLESVVNVYNDDPTVHRVEMLRVGSRDTLAVIPFYTTGQVVPSRAVAERVGVVELTCAVHPWSRGYVAAFDHPYFAVSDDNGRFAVADVPPGRYRVAVWHERLHSPVETNVEVPARGDALIDVSLPLGVAADTAPPREPRGSGG